MSFPIIAPTAPADDDPTPDSLFIPGDDDPEPRRDKVCAADGCGNEPERTPTGRLGKYCSEHKAAPKTGTRRTSTSRTKWKKAPEVRRALDQIVLFAGTGVSVIDPVDGQIIKAGGPNITEALVNLAEDDKNLQRYLEWLATPGKYGPLILATAGVVIPILANHGMIPTIPGLLGDGPDTRKE